MKRATAWPAYLVAAVCFAIALISSIANISLLGQVRQEQRSVATLSRRSTALARSLAQERTALLDVLDPDARRYPMGQGEVITDGRRIYLALDGLAEAPRGKVYQAWAVPAGSALPAASRTFLPNARGAAFVALPADGGAATHIVVTLEPEGGSKVPTSKPLMSATLQSP